MDERTEKHNNVINMTNIQDKQLVRKKNIFQNLIAATFMNLVQ